MRLLLVTESCKVFITSTLIVIVTIAQTVSFIKQCFIFGTITDTTFLESLHSCVVFHSTCVFINL